MEESIRLTDRQKDILQEIGNICAGNAANALSQLVGKTIEMSIPHIYFVKVTDVPQVVGGADQLVVSVVLQVLGDAPGVILLLFPQADARALSRLLTGNQTANGVLTELDQSSIKEAGWDI